MNETTMLERAAQASVSNPALLGFLLGRLSDRSGDLRDAATEIGVPYTKVIRLALCRAPRTDRWREDVDALAQATDIAVDSLIPCLRLLEALDALAPGETSQILLAARRNYSRSNTNTSESDVPPEDVG